MPSNTTRNHDDIRRWAEARGGHPALAGGRVLRIDFGAPEENLEPVEWDEFFRVFDESDVSFLHSTERQSRFNKFVRDE
jgi:hypothetical protein